MINVFMKKSAEELHIQLSDGRIMPLEDVIRAYERLLKEKSSNKTIKQELKVGEEFRIDRGIIAKNREKIRRVCNEAGDVGKSYFKRFEESNKIADENPDQYPRIIITYIFKYEGLGKTEQKMRDMCKEKYDGACDEVICDLELQMRICNGESAHALFIEADKLPRVRFIELRDGGTGFFGGGVVDGVRKPPAYLSRHVFCPDVKFCGSTPYAFRREA